MALKKEKVHPRKTNWFPKSYCCFVLTTICLPHTKLFVNVKKAHVYLPRLLSSIRRFKGAIQIIRDTLESGPGPK